MSDKKFNELFKKYGKDFINTLFEYHNIDEKIIEPLDMDISFYDEKLEADYSGRSIHDYDVNVNFQKHEPTSDDLYRFWKNSTILHAVYGNPVLEYVFIMEECSQEKYVYEWGPGNIVEFVVISLTDKDASERLIKKMNLNKKSE